MNRVAWVISPPEKGSGGFRTICTKASYLDQHGFECHFFILPGSEAYKSSGTVAEQIYLWFGYKPKSVRVEHTIPCNFDIAIATAWPTAEFVAFQSTPLKLYFIQDYEPWFYPMGECYLRAENTYRLDLKPITIGRWLSSKVSQYYPLSVPFCDFGVDMELYAANKNYREPFSVCAIYQPGKDRRLSGMLIKAIELVCTYDSRVSFYLYGSNQKVPTDSDRIHQLGVLTTSECADLYSRCSVGISLSASNPSRLPFEMLASGLNVVEVFGENTAYDFKSNAIRFSETSPEGIASALLSSLNETQVDCGELASIEVENQMFLDAVFNYQNNTVKPKGDTLADVRTLPVSINEELAQLARDVALINYKISADAQTPVCANHVSITLFMNIDFDSQTLIRAAYWLRSDQSDLKWIDFNRNRDQLEMAISMPSQISSESVLYIHLYSSDVITNQSLFLGEITQLISPSASESVNDLDRDISFGKLHFHVNFSQVDSVLDASKDASIASVLKSIYRR